MMEYLRTSYAGNEIWRFGLIFIIILVTLLIGRIVKFLFERQAKFWKERSENFQALELLTRCLSGPVEIVIFALGLHLSRLPLKFAPLGKNGEVMGLNPHIEALWMAGSSALMTVAIAYMFYRLVDVVEYYLLRWSSKTETKLDDMLVPMIRKALRVTITVLAALFITQNVLGQNISTILAGLGVGGLAVAFAARETIANFFGSIMIFSDRPFQIGDLVKVLDYYGSVEEVGLRSTRIRTLDGHIITIPNAEVANAPIENVTARPFIRKNMSITITYDTHVDQIEKASGIIRNVLENIPETSSDEEHAPRVYFDNFNDWSLNLLVYYWVKPAHWWTFLEVSQKANLEIKRRFDEEGIEFAFPTQTLYVEKAGES